MRVMLGVPDRHGSADAIKGSDGKLPSWIPPRWSVRPAVPRSRSDLRCLNQAGSLLDIAFVVAQHHFHALPAALHHEDRRGQGRGRVGQSAGPRVPRLVGKAADPGFPLDALVDLIEADTVRASPVVMLRNRWRDGLRPAGSRSFSIHSSNRLGTPALYGGRKLTMRSRASRPRLDFVNS